MHREEVMINDDELADLPENSELAFVQADKMMRERLDIKTKDANPGNVKYFRLRFMSQIIALADVYDIVPIKSQVVPKYVTDINAPVHLPSH